MAIALPSFLRVVPLLALIVSGAPAAAHAESVRARMQVTAQVVVRCTLTASVPPMGRANRASGTASFSVKCTRGASAVATACGEPCAAGNADGPRREYRVAETGGDGTTVATVLF